MGADERRKRKNGSFELAIQLINVHIYLLKSKNIYKFKIAKQKKIHYKSRERKVHLSNNISNQRIEKQTRLDYYNIEQLNVKVVLAFSLTQKPRKALSGSQHNVDVTTIKTVF